MLVLFNEVIHARGISTQASVIMNFWKYRKYLEDMLRQEKGATTLSLSNRTICVIPVVGNGGCF